MKHASTIASSNIPRAILDTLLLTPKSTHTPYRLTASYTYAHLFFLLFLKPVTFRMSCHDPAADWGSTSLFETLVRYSYAVNELLYLQDKD